MMTDQPSKTPGPTEPSLARIPFTKQDEATIVTMSMWMRLAGFISCFTGLVTILSGLTNLNLLANVIAGLLAVIMGLWLVSGAGSLKLVATTDTADQDHLVAGFQKLRNVFLLKSILVLIYLIIMFAVVVIVPFVLWIWRHLKG